MLVDAIRASKPLETGTMAEDGGLKRKDVWRFLMYIGLIALCLAAILYFLLNAHPREEPKIKEGSPNSHLTWPQVTPHLPPKMQPDPGAISQCVRYSVS